MGCVMVRMSKMWWLTGQFWETRKTYFVPWIGLRVRFLRILDSYESFFRETNQWSIQNLSFHDFLNSHPWFFTFFGFNFDFRFFIIVSFVWNFTFSLFESWNWELFLNEKPGWRRPASTAQLSTMSIEQWAPGQRGHSAAAACEQRSFIAKSKTNKQEFLCQEFYFSTKL